MQLNTPNLQKESFACRGDCHFFNALIKQHKKYLLSFQAWLKKQQTAYKTWDLMNLPNLISAVSLHSLGLDINECRKNPITFRYREGISRHRVTNTGPNKQRTSALWEQWGQQRELLEWKEPHLHLIYWVAHQQWFRKACSYLLDDKKSSPVHGNFIFGRN